MVGFENITMKAIILAAGEGKRLWPLTKSKPKPLLLVSRKTIIDRIIEELPDEITELIIVIGYKGDQIKEHLGTHVLGRPVTYVYQEKQLGTAHALGLCRQYIKPGERFMYIVGDDLHKKEFFEKLLKNERAVLVQEQEHPEHFGVVEVSEDGFVKSIEEKPEHPKSNLVSTGVFVLDDTLFNYQARLQDNGEYYMTDQIQKMIKDHKLKAEKTDFWQPIGYPEDLDRAEELLKKYDA